MPVDSPVISHPLKQRPWKQTAARVLTHLDPEGYVEIADGLVIRATWMGSGVAPSPGESTSVVIARPNAPSAPALAYYWSHDQ